MLHHWKRQSWAETVWLHGTYRKLRNLIGTVVEHWLISPGWERLGDGRRSLQGPRGRGAVTSPLRRTVTPRWVEIVPLHRSPPAETLLLRHIGSNSRYWWMAGRRHDNAFSQNAASLSRSSNKTDGERDRKAADYIIFAINNWSVDRENIAHNLITPISLITIWHRTRIWREI